MFTGITIICNAYLVQYLVICDHNCVTSDASPFMEYKCHFLREYLSDAIFFYNEIYQSFKPNYGSFFLLHPWYCMEIHYLPEYVVEKTNTQNK